MSIPRLVETHGWSHFRELEYQVCEKVASEAATTAMEGGWALIDAGGGVVVDLDEDGNEVYSQRKVDVLKREGLGKVVFLKRDVGYLVNRTSGDSNRPSLSASRTFQEIMARRAPWYEAAADYVLDATGGAIEARVKSKRDITEEALAYFYGVAGELPSSMPTRAAE